MYKASLQTALCVVIVLELAGCSGGNGNGTDTGTTPATAVNGATQAVFTPSFTNDGAVLAAKGHRRLAAIP